MPMKEFFTLTMTLTSLMARLHLYLAMNLLILVVTRQGPLGCSAFSQASSRQSSPTGRSFGSLARHPGEDQG